jgi:uncharacterized protein
MKVLVSVFLTIALLFGPATCTGVESREQKFANMEKKAAGGNVSAQYMLGLMYEQGYGVVQDKYQAAWCYREAAEKGHVQAHYRLGCLYYHGQEMLRDLQEAAAWSGKGAEQGDPEAQAAIENMHSIGESVHKLAKERRRETPEESF